MRLLKQLYIQVLIGVAAAIVLGLVAPSVALRMKPLGDGFIALLKMLLGPIIFCSVVHGLAQVRDLKKLGRLATKAIIYFEAISTLGMIIGAVTANVFHPGVGLHVTAESSSASGLGGVLAAAPKFSIINFLLGIIPLTPIDAFAKGDILQVLFISLLVGVAVSATLKRDSGDHVVGIGELQTNHLQDSQYHLMYMASDRSIRRTGWQLSEVPESEARSSYLGRFILDLLRGAVCFWSSLVFAGIAEGRGHFNHSRY